MRSGLTLIAALTLGGRDPPGPSAADPTPAGMDGTHLERLREAGLAAATSRDGVLCAEVADLLFWVDPDVVGFDNATGTTWRSST